MSDMNLYWGDIHNHCGISYGYGGLENALAAAREQCDFCSVTGHAMWHDMPERNPDLAFIVDFHQKGFAKLAQHWDEVRRTIEAANVPHTFVTLHSYEAHSSKYGDHHILSPSPDLPLAAGDSPLEMIARIAPRPAIAIPHHIAYAPGYRGIDWRDFSPAISPVVEVYSKHGCGMSDHAPYPYLHTMGPRDGRNTVHAGLELGHRFGFTVSTDHHAGYPGSYGDGRTAVLAAERTRRAIWEAILARRVYAVTGDKIACRFAVNGAPFGSETHISGRREIALSVTACDFLNRIVVYKNCRPWQAVCGQVVAPSARPRAFKVRIEMGWGRSDAGFRWQGEVGVRDGAIVGAESCFRGQSYLGPVAGKDEAPAINALDNRILQRTASRLAWTCTTFKNPSTLHSQTDALILEIQGDGQTTLAVTLNGRNVTMSLDDLRAGARAVHLKPYASEAFLIHRPVADTEYCVDACWEDAQPSEACDSYYAEIQQANGQCAWLSPVFVLP